MNKQTQLVLLGLFWMLRFCKMISDLRSILWIISLVHRLSISEQALCNSINRFHFSVEYYVCDRTVLKNRFGYWPHQELLQCAALKIYIPNQEAIRKQFLNLILYMSYRTETAACSKIYIPNQEAIRKQFSNLILYVSYRTKTGLLCWHGIAVSSTVLVGTLQARCW